MQPNKLVSTIGLERPEWLKYRMNGIGGSDASAICQASRFKSPLAVYMDKQGQLAELKDNAQMKAGRIMEPVIAEWFEEETGKRVYKRNFVFQHPEHKFMLANIDRQVTGENAGLEIKNTNQYCHDDWFEGSTETIPVEYQLQGNHYMYVMGWERVYYAVCIGGWDFQYRILERNEEIINYLVQIEMDFWYGNVWPMIPPDPNAQDTSLMKQIHPFSVAGSVELGEYHYEIVDQLLTSRKMLAVAKDKHEEYKNKMKNVMGEKELAIWQGEKLASWKSNKNGVRTFKIIGGEE